MEANYFTILYWFCYTSTWIHHGCTRVPHPEPPSYLPPHIITLGHPSAPAPSILYPALNLDCSFHIWYYTCFNAILPNHPPPSPLPLPQSPKDSSIHLCLLCCLTYRVIVKSITFENKLFEPDLSKLAIFFLKCIFHIIT